MVWPSDKWYNFYQNTNKYGRCLQVLPTAEATLMRLWWHVKALKETYLLWPGFLHQRYRCHDKLLRKTIIGWLRLRPVVEAHGNTTLESVSRWQVAVGYDVHWLREWSQKLWSASAMYGGKPHLTGWRKENEDSFHRVVTCHVSRHFESLSRQVDTTADVLHLVPRSDIRTFTMITYST